MEDKDYKKLYEEAVERAKYALTTDMDNSGHWAVNYIFPQLNENKDEKIRKALIHLVKSNKEGSFGIDNYDGIKWDDILSWIEIQEEHKHFRDCIQTGDEVTRNQDGDIVNLSQLKRIAKPKPKFEIGDWVIVQDKAPRQIEKVTELPYNHYQYWTTDGHWFGDGTEARSWTIQDAKDGDVLALNNEYFLFKEKKNSTTECYISHCFIDSAKTFRENGEFLPIEKGNKVCPTTKEQYDLLFSKMEEAGYEWDVEKKELKKIEQKPADKIEPKFKVGDWIVYEGLGTCKVVEIHEGWYSVIDSNDRRWSVMFEKESLCHLWTIQDAKDGDVLAEHETIVLFKKIEDQNIRCYCTYHYLGFNPTFYIGTLQNKDPYCPATKEQCDLLFQKMKETGYEWDAEKKELRTIENKSLSTEETELNSLAFLTELGYTCIPPTKKEKSAEWSEEDEKILRLSLENLTELKNRFGKEYGKVGDCMEWLKSIKDRVQPQPKQEWSEEDEEMFCSLKKLLNEASCYSCTEGSDKILNWLKSLKPNHWKLSEVKKETKNKCPYYSEGYGCETSPLKQCDTCPDYKLYNHWKPSEEQMRVLQTAIRDYGICHEKCVLESLYNDILKL